MDEQTNWLAPARVTLAALVMVPRPPAGVGAGQLLVLQAAGFSSGSARFLWAEAVQASGPDAVPVARPMAPALPRSSPA
jgi:hypothetical protein